MTSLTITPTVDRPSSRLRLIAPGAAAPRAVRGDGGSAAPASSAATNVLVAGADSARRSKMLGELRGLLPDGTSFVEAGETWQVLSEAGESRMVILTGDLGDISARGLLRVLSRRYPLLPVIALGDQRRPARSRDAGAASL